MGHACLLVSRALESQHGDAEIVETCRDLSTESCLLTLPEGDVMSCRFTAIAPVCHFGATVMKHTLITASPFGGGVKDEGLLVLVHLVLRPLQVITFVSLALVSSVHRFLTTSPRSIVGCAQPNCALCNHSLGF